MRPRFKNNSTIQYILISNGSPYKSPILPPEDFDNDVIDFIKECPMDILQITDSMSYLEIYLRNLWSYGFDFKIFNQKDSEFLIDYLNHSNQLQLIFLNDKSSQHKFLYDTLSKENMGLRYFHFYNAIGNLNSDNIIISPIHFIEIIVQNQNKILESLDIDGLEIFPSVALEYKGFNQFYYFIPTRTNYLLLNRIIGNFGNHGHNLSKDEIILKHKEESTKALLSKHSFDRQKLLNDQINKIDHFIYISYKEKIIKSISPSQPILSPLVLVVPFHNPDLKKLYGDSEIVESVQIEQTENYINLAEHNLNLGLSNAGMDIQRLRIKYLDNVSFLHSSFCNSPIIRLPLKGRSIYRELSFFRTKVFTNISLPRNRKNLKKTIYRYGKTLREKCLCPELEQTLKKRNGQIVAISDLPIEWLLLDGIPLSFTHDVCRLPETTLHGLMSLYTINQAIEFSISKNIIKKTLVILGAHDEGFLKWQHTVIGMSNVKGFKTAICNKNEDVNRAIKELKPEFLIFDCHGGYDEETRSTFLYIGDEKMDGKYIVNNHIFAPIVFLSACGTAPTYDLIQPIANAFFEVGALSVTSTYLPIDINSGSVLYLRILNNLEYCSDKSIHKNWLEFICHLIRTSSISEAYNKLIDNKEELDFNVINSNAHSLFKSQIFSARRKLFKELDDEISSISGIQKRYYSEVIPEYLIYSNLGRSDLILFDSWKEEYLKKNELSITKNAE